MGWAYKSAANHSHVYRSYVADGFAHDVDELMHGCLKEAPVTFKVFSKIFRRMKFDCIFLERSSGAELAELTEEAINMAKHYMTANTSTFETNIVGVFLVYALVTLQPFVDFASLRIVQEDMPYLERLELIARREKRVDVLFAMGHIFSESTLFGVACRERGMEPAFRKYFEGFTGLDLGLRPKGVFLRQNEELDIIRELNSLQLRYDTAKLACKADISYVDKMFAIRLDSSLKNVISGIHEPFKDSEESSDASLSVRSIKERAMKNKVDPIKHLIAVQNRSPTKTPKSPPNEPETSQNKSPARKAQKRKRSQSSSSSEESESDISIKLSDNEPECDLNLENFNKPKMPEEINEQVLDSNAINLNRLSDLPHIITTNEDGKTYEIEIIDHFNKSINNNSDSSNMPTLDNMNKRDLKKTLLKSRFKRMGIAPVANFKKS